MKMNYKKVIAGIIALLMCLTAVIGSNPAKAYAAEACTAYAVGYPRNGDANQIYSNEVWGHPALSHMNGWYSADILLTTLHCIGDYNGQVVYCIEPAIYREEGETLPGFGEDFWDNYPSNLNNTIQPDDIKVLLGRLLQYGYHGNLSLWWASQNPSDADKLAHAHATQLLVWETIVGERDENFNHVSTGGYDPIKAILRPGHPLYNQVCAYYDNMVAKVQSHGKLPSFMARSLGKAQEVELVWNGNAYTATLTDLNEVLQNYTFAVNDSDVQISTEGNNLTITSSVIPSGPVSITATKDTTRSGIITWSDGIHQGGHQDIITYSATVSDPIKAYLKVSVNYGDAKIIKTSEDGMISGITFTVEGEGINETVTTDENGEILLENLAGGTYAVTEEPLDLYEPQETQYVTVSNEETATVTFSNVLKRGNFRITKTAEDGLCEGVMFHLYGTSYSGFPVDEYASTDASGIAVFENILIGNGYTLEEVDTAEQYLVPEAQSVDIEWNKTLEVSVENILISGEIIGMKKDDSGAGLADATIGLYKGEDEEPIAVAVSEENGSFCFNDVPYGNYVVREIEAPERYLVDETPYEAVVSFDGETVELEITDIRIRGNVKLTKVDKDYPDNHLTGAVFEVYSDGILVGTLEELPDGVYELDGLEYGDYTLKEVKAPEGFWLDENTYEFSIMEDGVTVEVENEAGLGFINQVQTGSIRIEKTSEDGALSGFTFRVTGTDVTGIQFEEEYVTDENGEILITGLRVGEYVISEVANEANEQYELPANVTVTVYADRTVVARFYNRLIPTDIPYTGDSTNLVFWGAVVVSALIGAGVSAFFTFLKKEGNGIPESDEE